MSETSNIFINILAGIVAAAIVIFLMMTCYSMGVDETMDKYHFREDTKMIADSISAEYRKPPEITTADEMLYAIEYCNIEHADFVFAMAVLESGGFKSKIYVENNNCFGMREPAKRPTTATGSANGYAVYGSVIDCVIDFRLWQVATCKNLSRDDFIDHVGRVYAEDSTYVSVIKKLINKNGI
jgi:uncharacterized FlgJ-related protein